MQLIFQKYDNTERPSPAYGQRSNLVYILQNQLHYSVSCCKVLLTKTLCLGFLSFFKFVLDDSFVVYSLS